MPATPGAHTQVLGFLGEKIDFSSMVTYIVIYSIFQLTFVCFLVLLIDSEKLICYLWFQFSLQTDMTRRQLEYEARQIRAAMEEQLGTCQDMEKRAQVNGVFPHCAHHSSDDVLKFHIAARV